MNGNEDAELFRQVGAGLEKRGTEDTEVTRKRWKKIKRLGNEWNVRE